MGTPGPTADINLFRKSQKKFDKSQPFSGDKAFQGGTNITTPHKMKAKRELTQQQKDEKQFFVTEMHLPHEFGQGGLEVNFDLATPPI
ncbi:hypothetical protein [Dendronalium sp. ChiSLP03b]|uniref:hypothetical protein n=1 Tax=Dendronalium sp. ChiSLP03b TaxID=3075381 RepID=UPI002AD227B7|nr:hypothetical protein [Dendronalium sp. ChiSLP03b]MDZ8208550.1 hypothetical protein [Dendronalium sp. ChiSLP03b]